MKKIFLLLCSALLLVSELCAAPAAPAAPKRKRLNPLHEKAEQFRTYERDNIKPARLKKLREWFARKASGKSYTIPETSGTFADKSVVGFRS